VPRGRSVTDPYLRLGRLVARRPWWFLCAWALAIALGALGSHRLTQVTVGVEGGVPDSPSRRADEALRRDFSNPFLDPLLVAVSAPQLNVAQRPYFDWLRTTGQALTHLPQVRRVKSFADERDAQFASRDGHATMLLLGLAPGDNSARQQAVLAVRATLAPHIAALQRLDARARVAVTGGAAADLDVNLWSAAGGDRAEKRALPLTLAILIVAFGTLVAAALPFLTGLSTTTVSLGLAFLLARVMPVSNLLGNVVTMIGLAIGIDYSLLTVTHYREHAAAGSAAETVAATVARAGRTISWSGLTVIIGLLGLLLSPIVETRSVGVGGALVVCVSVLAALTLLPAALVLLGPRIDWLPVFRRNAGRARLLRFWRTLGAFIVRHPWATLALAGGCVLALAAPALRLKGGMSNERWFLPAQMESRVGLELLSGLRDDNAALALNVIVRTRDGSPLLAPAHLAPLFAYTQQLAQDARVAKVSSPYSLQDGLTLDDYQTLYEDPAQALHDYPQIAEYFLSHDQRAALFQLTPAAHATVRQIDSLARQLQAHPPPGPFLVLVSGAPAEHNDFNDYMLHSLPRIVSFVVCVTLLVLFAAFRSYLLPVKAVLMNLLAVATGIGAVVAVFQFGWLNGLVGLERPFLSIPLEIPLMVFCLSFGLSMDYELFLLFSIQRQYRLTGDNTQATVEGLAAVAPVITGAGLIMVAVFGAFIGAGLPVLKMTGVGLCVAVLVDATLIRALIVPAVMAIAGRWNWYPGRGPVSAAAPTRTAGPDA
jgi:putative drug exporter of the RND superfamily